MSAPIRELPRTELPRSLVLVAALLCGVLAAMAAQIILAQRGVELVAVWRDLFAARGLQLRAAGAWWTMSASAFLVAAILAAALSRFPLPWTRFRMLRWIAGGLIVLGLAHVGHSAESNAAIGMHVTTSFAALGAATLMALFGAYFAARR